MQFVLGKAPRKLTLAKIPGDNSCIFGALAHQLFMNDIKSKEHKRATKQLRADIVEDILLPGNFTFYEHYAIELTKYLKKTENQSLISKRNVNFSFGISFQRKKRGVALKHC